MHRPLGDLVAPPQIERRLWAAIVESVVLCGLAVACGWTMPPATRAAALVHIPTGSLLALLMLVELVTALTLGKAAYGLRVVVDERADQATTLPAIVRYLLRGVVRLAPVILLLLGVAASEPAMNLILCGAAAALATCYGAACYITIFRKGRTIFDLLAGTRVVRQLKAR